MNSDWYVVRVHSQHEKSVREAIEKKIKNMNLQDKVLNVVVPCEEIIKISRSKKTVQEKPYFPGYVFLNMIIDQETYWTVRNTPGVSEFLGGTQPVPLPEDEKKNLIELMEKPSNAKPKLAIAFEKGESVRIIDGPFRHFMGMVDEINEEKAKLKVMVTIFGRATPVELDFFQVEKL